MDQTELLETNSEPKKRKQFIDGARLNEEISTWRAACEKAETEVQMSEFIADAIIKIAERLSKRANFASYTYDMTGEAILSCVKYLHNYDPEKGASAFSYITQICWNSFLRQIEMEQKQSYIKSVAIQREHKSFSTQPGDSNRYGNGALQWLRDNEHEHTIIRNEAGVHPYERRISEKKARNKAAAKARKEND